MQGGYRGWESTGWIACFSSANRNRIRMYVKYSLLTESGGKVTFCRLGQSFKNG